MFFLLFWRGTKTNGAKLTKILNVLNKELIKRKGLNQNKNGFLESFSEVQKIEN